MTMRFLAALAFGALVSAQQPGTLTSKEKADGWILLFDGKSLDAWDDPAKKSPAGDAWSIDNGCIKATSRPKMRQDLYSKQIFGDFELAWEWKIAPKSNSGVKYRVQDRFWVDTKTNDPALKRFEDRVNYRILNRLPAPPEAGEEYGVAFEYQMIDNANFQPGRGELQRAGSLYDMIGASQDATRPAGEWNHSRILVRGKHTEHWLNGVKVVDADLDSEPVIAGIDKRWGAGKPMTESLRRAATTPGPISLQNHNDEAWFRGIKIRRLRENSSRPSR